MSTLRVDSPAFEYPDPRHGRAARCHLRLYEQGNGEVVLVATDLGDANPGASVTNTIEAIATAACLAFDVDPARLTVVEHYDDRRADRADAIGRTDGESFDVVSFRRVPRPRGAARPAVVGWPGEDGRGGNAFEGPHWKRISRHTAEALIGQALP